MEKMERRLQRNQLNKNHVQELVFLCIVTGRLHQQGYTKTFTAHMMEETSPTSDLFALSFKSQFLENVKRYSTIVKKR